MHTIRTIVLLLICSGSSFAADELSREQVDFFEKKIRPVLVRECYGCHSNQAGNVRGGLRLDTKELTLLGGSSGPAIVPGNLDESWLYNAITHTDFVMPPRRKLSDDIIADFKRWIEMGAPDPRVTTQGEIKSSITQDDIKKARDEFWAYQTPQSSSPPKVKDTTWPQSPVDQFVLAQLESAGLQPAGDAEAWQVLRRLSFDLLGLPPSPDHIREFEAAWQRDPQQAIAAAAKEMLDRPQFGERWGRHWLDVARYAESTGSQVNMTYPHAWRYRDYVIDSFNADKPFDQFVKEQLAGDLLPAADDEDWTENLIATGFLALGPKNVNEQNRVQFEADVIDEQIDATTRAFLGQSVACARCHDHKFDAIPQTDYYALAGVFGSMTTYFGNPPSKYGSFRGVQARRTSSLIRLPVEDPNPYDPRYTKAELAELEEELQSVMDGARQNRFQRPSGNDAQAAIRQRIRTANQLSELSNKLSVVDENGQPLSYCMGVQETDQPRDQRLLVRGEIGQPAQSVPRAFPQVLCATQPTIEGRSSGRRELAEWIASDENPLTARVYVNRVWKHLFGQGLVSSMENFGVTGQPPSHPELLDDLAVRFTQNGWSTKELVLELVTSRTYRMASTINEQHHKADPDNRLLWRANPRRLDAEALRDAMLAVSGQLQADRPRGSEVAKAGYRRVTGGVLGDPREIARKVVAEAVRNRFSAGGDDRGNGRIPFRRGTGGRTDGRRPFFNRGGERPDMQSLIEEARQKVANQLDMEDATFRSVYLPIVRDEEPRSLEVFDFADANTITGERESSNTANQALYLLNNGFVLQQSRATAERLAQVSSRPQDQLNEAFLMIYGRQPTAGESAAVANFIREFVPTVSGKDKLVETMSAVIQSLFASAEFRYLD